MQINKETHEKLSEAFARLGEAAECFSDAGFINTSAAIYLSAEKAMLEFEGVEVKEDIVMDSFDYDNTLSKIFEMDI